MRFDFFNWLVCTGWTSNKGTYTSTIEDSYNGTDLICSIEQYTNNHYPSIRISLGSEIVYAGRVPKTEAEVIQLFVQIFHAL